MGFRTLLESDRQYGQNYGTTLYLTKEGLELAKDHDEDMFTRTDNIKVALVNPNNKYNAQIKDQVLRTYPNLINQNSEHSMNIKNSLGLLYINNSPEGTDIDKLNLYTMPAGESRTWTVRGAEYQINTTTRDAIQSDLMNVDFNLSKVKDGKNYVMAINSGGVS